MKRRLEPELMVTAEQAIAYAQADFSESNALFIRLLDALEPGDLVGARALARFGRFYADAIVAAGISVRESVAIIQAQGARPVGVLIALDRQEQGQDGRSAIAELREHYGLPVFSIVTLVDLIAYLRTDPTISDLLPAIEDYRTRYGSRTTN